MRREGFELSISPPRVIYKRGEGKTILEPIEHVTILVAHDIAGTVIESMTRRKGEMITYVDAAEMAKLDFRIPTRGLLGYPAEFKNTTHGQATLNHILLGYEEYKGEIEKQRTGSIISTALGQTTPYALINIEPRGKLHVGGNEKVYPGMIIGQHNRESDLEVNPVKAKHLSNVRAAGKEDTIKLVPKQEASLEKMMAYIQDDEVIEVTPISIRIRKKILDASKRAATKKKNPLDSITFE